jgi:hypothetical protein
MTSKPIKISFAAVAPTAGAFQATRGAAAPAGPKTRRTRSRGAATRRPAPAGPGRPRLGLVHEDGLHPDDAGSPAIARAVDLGGL